MNDLAREMNRRAVAAEAAAWVAMNPVYLDTETTGLGNDAEIVSIAVVDSDGSTLLSTLVRPVRPIPADATAIHHITNEMVAEMRAPEFDVVLPHLHEIIGDRRVVIYNASYDTRMIRQSAIARGLHYGLDIGGCYCAMELYAMYYGDWNEYHQSYKWQKLSAAAAQCGLTWTGEAHGSLADAIMTCHLVGWLAAQHEAAE